VLSDLIRQLGRTASGFAPPGTEDVGPLVAYADRTVAATAGNRGAIGHLLDLLRPFEDQALRTLPTATPLLVEATTMSQQLSPALAQLHAALPRLNALLSRARDLPALTQLANSALPVLASGVKLLPSLTPVGATLPPLFAALVPLANYLAPYRQDMLRDMQLFEAWSQFGYPNGLASGAKAVRFSPVFTCSQLSKPYPRPGESATVHASSLAAACQ
jgi:ABC-type transporter Mla subunit MlaD